MRHVCAGKSQHCIAWLTAGSGIVLGCEDLGVHRTEDSLQVCVARRKRYSSWNHALCKCGTCGILPSESFWSRIRCSNSNLAAGKRETPHRFPSTTNPCSSGSSAQLPIQTRAFGILQRQLPQEPHQFLARTVPCANLPELHLDACVLRESLPQDAELGRRASRVLGHVNVIHFVPTRGSP